MKIKANGIEINYEIEGEGPVVTFSHSLACNLSMWDEQVRGTREPLPRPALRHARPRADRARPRAPTRSTSSRTISRACSTGSVYARPTSWGSRWAA